MKETQVETQGGVQGSQMEKGKEFSPNEEPILDFFERKVDQAFQGESAVQTKLSEAQDRREWNMQNADNSS